MIASLTGIIEHKNPLGVVIDVNGVGYGVAMSVTSLSQLVQDGSSAKILIHTHVSQDSIRLFGFLNDSERRCFEILIATSGVGPKLALGVLSTFAPHELARIVRDKELSTLVRIPGVGKKKAERLVLELRERLPAALLSSGDTGELGAATPLSLADDLGSALVNLGYKEKIAAKVAAEILERHPEQTDLAILVREALRSLSQK